MYLYDFADHSFYYIPSKGVVPGKLLAGGAFVCEEKSWRAQAAARSAFQYVSHRPLW
jgi:hypothetical protein